MRNVILTTVMFWSMIKASVKAGAVMCNGYRVNYSVKSNSRRHYIPALRIWSGNMFSFGNSKLANNIAIFSLMEILTCLDCKSCAGSCYAKKSNRYATSYNHKLINTFLAVNDLELLKSFIIEDLQHLPKKIKFVRIHEAGDFFNQNYIAMWYDVARMFPGLRFYFYTKSDKYLNFGDRPNNVNMVYSLLPGGEKNYGTMQDYLDLCAKYPDLKIKLCSYGTDNALKCGVQCTLCMQYDYVFFLEH